MRTASMNKKSLNFGANFKIWTNIGLLHKIDKCTASTGIYHVTCYSIKLTFITNLFLLLASVTLRGENNATQNEKLPVIDLSTKVSFGLRWNGFSCLNMLRNAILQFSPNRKTNYVASGTASDVSHISVLSIYISFLFFFKQKLLYKALLYNKI